MTYRERAYYIAQLAGKLPGEPGFDALVSLIVRQLEEVIKTGGNCQ